MLSPLLVALSIVVLSPPQGQPKSLWQQVFNGPATGRNGYEEYVQAAELLQKQPIRDMMDRARASSETATSFLSARRQVVARGKAALDLVRRGSTKEVLDPRTGGDYLTLFPELALFKRIAQLFQMEAYVRFADGDSAAGVRSMIDGIEFSRRASQGTLISFLVGLASQAIVLGEAEERLPQLSQAGAASLGAAARRWLADPDPLIRGVRGEFDFIARSIDTALAGKPAPDELDLVDMVGDEDVKKIDSILRMSPSAKALLAQEVKTRVRQDYEQVLQVLQRPERDWRLLEEEVEPGNNPADFLHQLFKPAFDQSLIAAARSRTQLRLLALHCSVIVYRWETHQLPARLEDFEEEGLRLDPLSGKPFVYRFLGDGRYELYSEGSEATGRIDLRYRRQPGLSPPEPEPPSR